MDWISRIDAEKLLVFTLVLTRVSGLFVTAPVYGTQEAPATVRALLSVALAALIMPTQWNASIATPDTTIQYMLIIGGELLIGLTLGMGIMVMLTGIQMAGELMSRIGGLTLSDIYDPTSGATVPLFSRLLALVSTAVFMLIGGHRILLGGLLDTFRTVPPGGVVAMILGRTRAAGSNGTTFLQSLLDMFVVLITQSFHVGVRASIPIVTAVLLATLVLGLIGRTVPQLNVMAVGFGVNSMATFALLSLSLGAVIFVFREQIVPTLQLLFRTLNVPIQS